MKLFYFLCICVFMFCFQVSVYQLVCMTFGFINEHILAKLESIGKICTCKPQSGLAHRHHSDLILLSLFILLTRTFSFKLCTKFCFFPTRNYMTELSDNMKCCKAVNKNDQNKKKKRKKNRHKILNLCSGKRFYN